MSDIKKIRNELTLIDSVIKHSKAIVIAKHALLSKRVSRYLTAYIPGDFIRSSGTIDEEVSLKWYIDSKCKHVARMINPLFKSTNIKPVEKFWLGLSDLMYGYVELGTPDITHILFLTKFTDSFIEYKAGDIIKYDDCKKILNQTKSVIAKDDISFRLILNQNKWNKKNRRVFQSEESSK